MSFHHVKIEYPVITREEKPNGDRIYLVPDGKSYPSLTTVIKAHNKKAIDNWKQRVGESTAKRIQENASSRGHIVHECIETLLMNFPVTEIQKSMQLKAKAVYLSMKKTLVDKVTEVYGLEQPLFSHKLRVAGTADFIGKYDGKMSIVDFKTSTRKRKKEWNTGYYMQLTGYAFMFEEMTGIRIEQGVILAGIDNEPLVQEFVLDRKDFGKYLKELVSWRDKYESAESSAGL